MRLYQRPALPCGDYPGGWSSTAGTDAQTFRRHEVGQRPALPGGELPKPVVGRGRWYRYGNVSTSWGCYQRALPCEELPKPVVGRTAGTDTETFRRRGVAYQRSLPCGELPKPVVGSTAGQIRNRSDVMRLFTSGRHYPCGELPKPLVGSATAGADTETFRRHGVAYQRALPVRGVGARRWARGPESGTIASPPPHARSR